MPHLIKTEGVKFTPFWCAFSCCFTGCPSLQLHHRANRCPAHWARLLAGSSPPQHVHIRYMSEDDGFKSLMAVWASCCGIQVSVMFANVWMCNTELLWLLVVDLFQLYLWNISRAYLKKYFAPQTQTISFWSTSCCSAMGWMIFCNKMFSFY